LGLGPPAPPRGTGAAPPGPLEPSSPSWGPGGCRAPRTPRRPSTPGTVAPTATPARRPPTDLRGPEGVGTGGGSRDQPAARRVACHRWGCLEAGGRRDNATALGMRDGDQISVHFRGSRASTAGGPFAIPRGPTRSMTQPHIALSRTARPASSLSYHTPPPHLKEVLTTPPPTLCQKFSMPREGSGKVSKVRTPPSPCRAFGNARFPTTGCAAPPPRFPSGGIPRMAAARRVRPLPSGFSSVGGGGGGGGGEVPIRRYGRGPPDPLSPPHASQVRGCL